MSDYYVGLDVHKASICLLQCGSKSDRVDARKLARLLRAGPLSPVYHGEHG